MANELDLEMKQAGKGVAFDRQLESSLRDIGIPPRPRILELVHLESRADEPNLNYLADLIMGDVALAASLIKTANSPFFGYRNKTRHVHDALIMLGLRAAGNAIAAIILRRLLPPSPPLVRYWDACERTAQLSAWLVHKVGVRFGVTSEDAYTYALFRDCGIPILMRRFDGYLETLARANADPVRSFTAVEEEDVPVNHALVGGLMVQSWWLPDDLCLAVRKHHHLTAVASGSLTGAASRLIALAQLAERLHQNETGLNQTREWDKLGAACLDVLNMDELFLAEVEDEAGGFMAELATY